ncbi:hypothetical protein [Herbiconiux sp.]|uniref:hypothetical protein n=1 Tax=Herbiconiux sp. TaxID=1871186 RepID=UPI0025C65315|nr:hypothetical protein [Herbiconiux sp.]
MSTTTPAPDPSAAAVGDVTLAEVAVAEAETVAEAAVSAPADTILARELAALVGAVPGVTALYPARSAPASLVSAVLAAAARGPATAAAAIAEPVAVSGAPEALSISVTIGVDPSASAAELCRTVHDRLRDHLAAAGLPPAAGIRVHVGAIG